MGLNCEVGINSSSHDKPGIGNGMMTWLYQGSDPEDHRIPRERQTGVATLRVRSASGSLGETHTYH